MYKPLAFEKTSEITVEFDKNNYHGIVRDVYNDIRIKLLSSDPILNKILKQIFTQRGKGIRSVFMALVAELVGGSWESLRKAALVIEAVHLASLLHDDVVDGSELRRGVATLNAGYSDKISVLFGDHIFVNALTIADEIENHEAVSIIHKAVKLMVEGEICDTLREKIVDEDTYIKIISDKTASLFAGSGELGIILSGVDGIERIWARELGESIGIAFQIIDDTLDYNGNKEMMGKPVFMDVMSGNMTLPLIHSLRGMTFEEKKDIIIDNKVSVEKLSELVRKNNGIEYAYKVVHDYSERAREILARFDNKKIYPVFDSFIDIMMVRHF